MIIYYSGEQVKDVRPEKLIGKPACIMLTYFDNMKKPQERFLTILKTRKKNKRNNK